MYSIIENKNNRSMKRQRTQSRQAINSAKLILVYLLLFSLYSCSDELKMDRESISNKIAFSPTINGGWVSSGNKSSDASTRVRKSNKAESISVLPIQEQDNLWMHCIVDTIGDERVSDTLSQVSLKGAPITSADVNNIDFNVLGYAYVGDWSESLSPNLMNDIEVISDGSGNWSLPEDYYWVSNSDAKYRFYGYTPSSYLRLKSSTGAPKLSYTVPADVKLQKDIMVAVSEHPGNYKSNVNFSFNHILTAISFSVSDKIKTGTIEKIRLNKIYRNADYSFPSSLNTAGSWGNHGGKTNYEIKFNKPVTEGVAEDITLGETTGMMLPQTLGSDAELVVYFIDTKNQLQKATINIGGMVWSPGRKVKFVLSHNRVVVDYSGLQDLEFSHRKSTPVTIPFSYTAINSSGEAVGLRWRMWFRESGGDWTASAPSNLSVTPRNGTDIDSENILRNILVKANDAVPRRTNSSDAKLKSTTPVSDVDLSMIYGTRNTANCYVVNAPGTYRFPIVYGNAIKNGKTNIHSYKRIRSSHHNNYALTNLKNHLDKAISDPYLKNNAGCNIDNVCLVWQDAPDLVTKISISGDDIIFEVPPSSIRQGNAILAVRDASNNIMWSWHIWVTDCDLGQNRKVGPDDKYMETIYCNEGAVYNMLSRPVGYCTGDSIHYDERNIEYKIVFPDYEMETDVYTITQLGYKDLWPCSVTYYQNGRKDPVPPFVANGYIGSRDVFDFSKKPLYGDYIYDYIDISEDTVALSTTILNPHVYYKGKSYVAANTNYSKDKINLWAMNIGGVNDGFNYGLALPGLPDASVYTYTVDGNPMVIKTIYDPSPAGYMVAPSGVITCFMKYETMTNTRGQMRYYEKIVCKENNQRLGFSFPIKTDRYDSGAVVLDESSIFYLPASKMLSDVNRHISLSSFWTFGRRYEYVGGPWFPKEDFMMITVTETDISHGKIMLSVREDYAK